MLITNQPHTIFPTATAAQTVIDKMGLPDPDGWRYQVVPDPKGSGRATIRVFDETGEEVGLL